METNGTGSIVQLEKGKPKGKCRKWQLRVSVGLDPRTGKYRQRTRTFNGTYTEAKRALPEFVKELKGKSLAEPLRHPTFEECAEEWLKMRSAAGEVSKNTIHSYRSGLGALALHLGKAKVGRITPQMVQEALASLAKGDTKSGKPLCARSLHHAYVAGKAMYSRHAVPRGYAEGNPFDEVAQPRYRKRKQVALTESEFQALKQAMLPVSSGKQMAVLLGLLAGLRIGECCHDLAWRDWDGGGRLQVNGTKGESSFANVPISADLTAALGQWKEEQAAQMSAAGIAQTDRTPICSNSFFASMSPSVLGEWWKRERAHIGFPDMRFHDLRHAFVARCCMRGVNPKAIQRLARHATFSVTMDVYAAVTDGVLEESAALL